MGKYLVGWEHDDDDDDDDGDDEHDDDQILVIEHWGVVAVGQGLSPHLKMMMRKALKTFMEKMSSNDDDDDDDVNLLGVVLTGPAGHAQLARCSTPQTWSS